VGYQLSAQLAAMEQNVRTGHVKTTDLLYAGSLLAHAPRGLTAGGFISIGDLLKAANATLALNDPNSAYESALVAALQAANNNSSFVQRAAALDALYAPGNRV
jgi:hypothetical protein